LPKTLILGKVQTAGRVLVAEACTRSAGGQATPLRTGENRPCEYQARRARAAGYMNSRPCRFSAARPSTWQTPPVQPRFLSV